MYLVLIHVNNEDPVLGEVDQLPNPTDIMITVKNPRRRDNKDLTYLEVNVTTVIWPLSRINYIEIMPSAEEDDIISMVRE
jgi:hypothetical protein